MEEKSYVLDTSVIIEKAVSKMVKEKKLSGKIIITRASLAELENQANQGQEIGFIGLEEIQELQKLSKQEKIKLTFLGTRPSISQIRYAKIGGEIDAVIRDIAYNEGAILITADKIQSESAKALGMEVIFLEFKELKEKLEFEKYFDPGTMSVHLREDTIARAKRGMPGQWSLDDIGAEILTTLQVQKMAKEIVERARTEQKAFIEISRPGSTVVQFHTYRIVITKPPVSDAWEITAVRPIKQLNIEDYNLPEQISERIKTKARGVIVAGETGSGKSTFAQSLAEFYASRSNIVKTVESPRDLILSDKITQYSKNLASSEEIHDILFLSRPDYIIFDEMRDTPDFKLYVDLRLGGSNVLGVLHAATPIDAIQRFIGRIDTGMIPSVLDTLIYIDKGSVGKILTVSMTVKVPAGMTEADLARPIVIISDFLTNKVEFEIYSYGEQTVVVPTSKVSSSDPSKELAAKQIEKELRKYVSKVKAVVTGSNRAEIHVPKEEIGSVIGKEGKNIERIEKELGISLDVRELSNYKEEQKEKGEEENIQYSINERGKDMQIFVDPIYAEREASIYVNDQFLIASTIGRKGKIKINKKSKFGQTLSNALRSNKKVEVKA